MSDKKPYCSNCNYGPIPNYGVCGAMCPQCGRAYGEVWK